MRTIKSSLAADVAFIALMLLLFVCTVFVSLNPDNFFFNGSALLIVFVLMILTYFTSITTGLITNLILIFITSTYFLLGVVTRGGTVYTGFYFWMILSPLTTIATGLIFRDTKKIEKDYLKIKQHMDEFSGIDPDTNLKNKQSYLSEISVFRGIASRYDLKVLLIICEFRYPREMKNLLGETLMEKLAIEISQASEKTFRQEDIPYLLSRDPYRWGILMLTKPNSEYIIKNRLREKFESLDMNSIAGKNAPRLELRIGMAYDSEKTESPFQLLEEAIDQMQYDV